MKNVFAVIMAGGIGSRFWPISRTSHPKQFIDILGTGRTLIQSTYDRFKKLIPEENIYIVTNEIYTGIIKEQLPGITDQQILAEPVMRNTAPCIAYACHKIYVSNPDAAIVVAPSDHLITDPEEFLKNISASLEAAIEHNCLITLGIKPSRPDTGYGYIQYASKTLNENFHKVKTFTEKPGIELAKTFIQSGDFLWNAGIFVWSVKAILKAFENYLPEMNDIFKEGEGSYNTPNEQTFIQNAYYQCTNISIDYGIMEKADNVYVLPTDFGWSDLGTWASVYELTEKDYVGNAVIPSDKVIMYDSSNCMVNVPSNKLVILKGLHDYIVVEANNTLMICPKDQEQNVKQVVADVKSKFGVEFI
ncbi:mannose-1-phosphate guanylyltransferase [Hufsiella ginkgonis]|uniref:mannose-1-phosphate guanylyltransferase n=1 Tax=Hufsiella ginkgonis TaxID=2695274 RepID=A0A7K1XWE6_9SPHI|nr:mannose-1-phosphate guanylyltransferase [Hufsiella ginkgonis]MXV15108.1 mannose-1-phosphate guanylyltransferase [Hufsiella ginkgonis]